LNNPANGKRVAPSLIKRTPGAVYEGVDELEKSVFTKQTQPGAKRERDSAKPL
jgi:hypothetical protein